MEVKYDPYSTRAVVERILYVLSLLSISVSLNILFISIEALIFFISVYLLGMYNYSFSYNNLLYSLGGIILGSLSIAASISFRFIGIRYLRFLIHEDEFNSILEDIEDREEIRTQLIEFKEKIDQAEGYERQNIRQEAKEFLEKNMEAFDNTEQKYITEYFYYLVDIQPLKEENEEDSKEEK